MNNNIFILLFKLLTQILLSFFRPFAIICLIVFIYMFLFPKNNFKSKVKRNKNNYDYNKNNYYKDDGFYPYHKKTYLFTRSEEYFFEILNEIVKNTEYHVFPKVRLWDIVHIWSNYKNDYASQNKIKSKHVDYVICKGQKFTPVLIIELDGKSHQTDPDTIYNDNVKDNILKAAKLPLMRVQAKDSKDDYDIDYIKSEILDIIECFKGD